MQSLTPDHLEQLARFDAEQLGRHGLIAARLIGVGWNEASAVFLAVERVMEEVAAARMEGLETGKKSTARPLTNSGTIVKDSTVVPT